MEQTTVQAPVAASVDTVAPEFLAQQERQRLPQDLCGGAEAMRRAGERYVEKGEGETAKAYEARLNRPALLNSFKRTLAFMRGQVFQKAVALGEDADEATLAWAEDVDRQGHSLTTWSAETFEAGLRDGIVFCLADYSRVELRTAESGALEYMDKDGQWKPKTAAADAAHGWAPYLIRIEAGSVLDVWTETAESGASVVTRLRYMERGLEPSALSEWSRQAVDRIHEWKPDSWRRYVRHGGAGAWELEAEGVNSLGRIPLSVFMPGERRGPMSAAPALADLAELNRRHWAASAGHCELMEFVRRPVWFGRGIGAIRNADGTESDVSVSAGRLICTETADADLKSVGIEASAVSASAQELETLKGEMALYGLQLLQPRGGTQTATEVERNSSESNSTLQAWAASFGDFLENVLRDCAQWRGMEDGCSVSVNTTFSRRTSDDYLLELYRAGAVSLETLLALLKAAGTLPDDFDVDGEAERMARGLLMNGSGTGIASLSAALSASAKG